MRRFSFCITGIAWQGQQLAVELADVLSSSLLILQVAFSDVERFIRELGTQTSLRLNRRVPSQAQR